MNESSSTTQAIAQGEDERSSSTTQAIAQGEDGRRNKFLLPSRLRLNERSSSTTQAIAQGEDERSSSTNIFVSLVCIRILVSRFTRFQQ